MNAARNQARAFDRGKSNQRPIKQSKKKERADNSPDHESDDGIVCMIHQKRRGDGDGHASANKKTCHGDREFLEKKSEQSTDQAKSEGEEEGKPEGRALAQMRGELEANRKAERRDEKPKEPATEKEKRQSDQRADHRQRKIHTRQSS